MKNAAVFAAAALALLALPARADERITDFRSDVVVDETGGIEVSEKISVVSEGLQIVHGIYQNLPIFRADDCDDAAPIPVRVSKVTRDGVNEPYVVESSDTAVRVRIGAANIELPVGIHIYTISYQVGSQVSFHADYDEIDWNISGTYWDFPIDHAEAIVHLPNGAKISASSLYNNATNAPKTSAISLPLSDKDIEFDTIRGLKKTEGLTLAIKFNKGVVKSRDSVIGSERCGKFAV